MGGHPVAHSGLRADVALTMALHREELTRATEAATCVYAHQMFARDPPDNGPTAASSQVFSPWFASLPVRSWPATPGLSRYAADRA